MEKNSSALVSLGVSYAQDNWELGLDAFNVFDRDDDDIAYFFESRLSGEIDAVEDIHFHPSNPTHVRLLMKYRF